MSPEGGDIAPVGADRVTALAVQPEADELLFGGVGRDGSEWIGGGAVASTGGAGSGLGVMLDPI